MVYLLTFLIAVFAITVIIFVWHLVKSIIHRKDYYKSSHHNGKVILWALFVNIANLIFQVSYLFYK